MSFVFSKWMGWPQYSVAYIARILQAFNMLLNVLPQVTGIFWRISTSCAVISINLLFHHCFSFFHCGRLNNCLWSLVSVHMASSLRQHVRFQTVQTLTFVSLARFAFYSRPPFPWFWMFEKDTPGFLFQTCHQDLSVEVPQPVQENPPIPLDKHLPLQDIESRWLPSSCEPSSLSGKSRAEDVGKSSVVSWRRGYKPKEPLCGPWCSDPHRPGWHRWSHCQL